MLTDAQCFSKVFYVKYYRDPITLKWRETYLAYYNKRIKEDPRLTDAEEIKQRVQDDIRSDLRAGRLDITVAAASAVEGENEDGEEDQDQDGEGGEDQDGQDGGGQDGEEDGGEDGKGDEGEDGEDQDGKEGEDEDGEEGENQDGEEGENQDGQEDEDQAEEDAELFSDEVGVNLPKVAVWYRNAVMKNIWEKASPSQRDAVEQYKTKEDMDDVGDDSMEDDERKVKRLQNLIKFVTSPIW